MNKEEMELIMLAAAFGGGSLGFVIVGVLWVIDKIRTWRTPIICAKDLRKRKSIDPNLIKYGWH